MFSGNSGPEELGSRCAGPSHEELSMFGAAAPQAQEPRRRVLRVGGVHEHFNYPWQLGDYFKEYNCEVDFNVMSCGTGQMIEALKNGEVDMIVALTEGLVKDIAQGSDLRLVATYVESPLCWAVSAGAKSDIHTVQDLRGKRFGISRYTSGSHLMASVLAIQQGWDPATDINFKVEGQFKNLRDSVNRRNAGTDAFMWETFTTKPYHDSGEVRRVGEIYSPWPAFMLAVRETTIQRDPDLVRDVLRGIRDAAGYFSRAIHAMPREIAIEFKQQEADVKEWYENVTITGSTTIRPDAINKVIHHFTNAKVLPAAEYPPENFLGLDAELDVSANEKLEVRQEGQTRGETRSGEDYRAGKMAHCLDRTVDMASWDTSCGIWEDTDAKQQEVVWAEHHQLYRHYC